jgi:ribosomal protein S8
MSESIEIEEKEKEKTFEILKDLKELLMKGVFESFDFYFEDFKISENEFKEIIDDNINKYKWSSGNVNIAETFEFPNDRRLFFVYSIEEKEKEKIYDILYIKGYIKDFKIKKRKIGEITQKKILKNLIELTEQFKEGKYDRFDINFMKYPEIREIDFEGLIKDFKGMHGFFINQKFAVDTYYYNPNLKKSDNTYDISIKNIYLAYNIKETDYDVTNPKIYIIYYIGGRKEGFLKEKT